MNDLQTCMEKQVMTVKEIAQAMGVSTDTVKNCIRRIMPNKMQNGKTTFLNEQEVAIISKELKSNTFVSSHQTYEVSSQVKNTTTELEVMQNYKQATEAMIAMLSAKTEALKAENEAQKQRLAIAEPKAKWFDDFADCTGLIEIGVVGKHLEPYGLGALKIFDRLKADGIIYEKNNRRREELFCIFPLQAVFCASQWQICKTRWKENCIFKADVYKNRRAMVRKQVFQK